MPGLPKTARCAMVQLMKPAYPKLAYADRRDEIVARAQTLSRRLLADKPEASIEAFLAERRREAERE